MARLEICLRPPKSSWAQRARKSNPTGSKHPIGYNEKGPQRGPFSLAYLMCESSNLLLEWLGEIAILCAADSWICLPTVDMCRTNAKSEEAPGA
jgi:hypothetical protein